MEAGLLGVVMSAIIAGVFQLLGKRMELAHAGPGGGVGSVHTPTTVLGSTMPRPNSPQTPATTVPGQVNYGLVVRHVGILQLVLNAIGFFLGLLIGASGGDLESAIVVMLVLGTAILAAGFVWVAKKVETDVMWKHLSFVALGVVILTLLINSIFLQAAITFLGLVVAFFQTYLSMAIGGAIANHNRKTG